MNRTRQCKTECGPCPTPSDFSPYSPAMYFDQAAIFMGAIMGTIFGKNLPKKGKKFPNALTSEIDKSLNPQHKRDF